MDNLMSLYGFWLKCTSKSEQNSQFGVQKQEAQVQDLCEEVLMTIISRQLWNLVLFAGLVLNTYPNLSDTLITHFPLPKHFVTFTSTYSVK